MSASTQIDRPSLLLVEDDTLMAEALAAALARRGYAVDVSHTLAEARKHITDKPPAFAVVDLRLPDGSGLCVVRTLKQVNATTAIVVLTGYASIATAIEAIKLGAGNYLCKPINADAVVSALQGPRACSPAPITEPALTVPLLEREHITHVLANNQSNISATARALRMHRRTLQRKLAKLCGAQQVQLTPGEG